MTLRGEIESFPLETVVQLIHSTSKTGQLEVRGGDDASGTLGFDGGRLVAALAGDDVGEPALGAVFAIAGGVFEFIPWTDAPAANLSGDLDQLLDKAVEERDRIVAIRAVIPDDRSRFRLSERAAEKGNITLSPDQWRTLLAVNGDRDVNSVAEHLKSSKLATRTSLAALVDAGFIDVLEPAEEQTPPPQAATHAPAPGPPPSEPAWTPPAAEWRAPEPTPPARSASWDEPAASAAPQAWAPPAQSWEQPKQDWERPAESRDRPAESWERPAEPETSAAPVEPEVAPAPSAIDVPPAPDERLAALSGLFGPAPVAPEAAPAPPPDIAPPADRRDAIDEWSRPAPTMPEAAPEEQKKGRFGFLRREAPARDGDGAGSASTAPVAGRAGQLASLANALLGEYNSGQYGKNRLDDRMANLLMRVDEQADPIDRPLPIVDDRIDSQALDREEVPEQQAVPYLAILVTQIFEDAERAFGKDKAKRGYKAAQQQVFGTDPSALSAPDVAGRLPKV